MKHMLTGLRILGAEVVFVLSAGVVFGAFWLAGLAQGIYDDYLTRALADLLLAVLASALVMAYADRLGDVAVGEFRFALSRRDLAFTAFMVVLVLGCGAAYGWLLSAAAVRSISLVMPALPALAIGVLGELGVLHEEVTSRGYVLRLLHRRYGAGVALVVSSLVFSLSHVIFKDVDFMLVGHLLAGLVLGYAYLKSGTLLVPIVLHAAHNLMADLFLQGNDEGVSLGIGAYQFAEPLGLTYRLPFDAAMTLLELLAIWAWYGRGHPLLAVHSRLEVSEAPGSVSDRAELSRNAA